MMQGIDGRQSNDPLSDITAGRLAQGFFISHQVQDVISDLKSHPQIITIFLKHLNIFFFSIADHGSQLAADGNKQAG